jgi:uncharacterized protein YjiS (DUF1127 family)
MAFATETRSIHVGIFDRIATFAKEMAAFNAQYRVYRATVRELSVLSNRDLADLGLNRSMISDVARVAAYGE